MVRAAESGIIIRPAHADERPGQTLIGKVQLDLFQTAFGQEGGKTVNDGNQSRRRHTGSHTDHGLFQNTDIVDAVGEFLKAIPQAPSAHIPQNNHHTFVFPQKIQNGFR